MNGSRGRLAILALAVLLACGRRAVPAALLLSPKMAQDRS